MISKNFLILGATGNIGQKLVGMALARGHKVTALVRSETKIQERAGLTVVQGNPQDAELLNRIMPGHDAVLSCLGIRRENQADPWSPVISPTDLTERSALNTVNAMKDHGVARVIAISAAGVGDSKHISDPEITSMVDSSNVAISFRDLEKMEHVFVQSGLDTLVVRPVTLVEGEPSDRAGIVEAYKATSQISKSDVSTWMMDAVERTETFEHRVEMIGYA